MNADKPVRVATICQHNRMNKISSSAGNISPAQRERVRRGLLFIEAAFDSLMFRPVFAHFLFNRRTMDAVPDLDQRHYLFRPGFETGQMRCSGGRQ